MTPWRTSVLRFIRSACGPICRAIACPDRRTLGRVGQQVPAGMQVAEDQDLLLGRCPPCGRQPAPGPHPADRPRWPEPNSRPACRSASRTAPGGRYPAASAAPGAARRAGSDRCRSKPTAASPPKPVQPPLDGPLERVRQALAAELARADELHQRAQDAAVVHNAVEDLAEQGRITLRQDQQRPPACPSSWPAGGCRPPAWPGRRCRPPGRRASSAWPSCSSASA